RNRGSQQGYVASPGYRAKPAPELQRERSCQERQCEAYVPALAEHKRSHQLGGQAGRFPEHRQAYNQSPLARSEAAPKERPGIVTHPAAAQVGASATGTMHPEGPFSEGRPNGHTNPTCPPSSSESDDNNSSCAVPCTDIVPFSPKTASCPGNTLALPSAPTPAAPQPLVLPPPAPSTSVTWHQLADMCPRTARGRTLRVRLLDEPVPFFRWTVLAVDAVGNVALLAFYHSDQHNPPLPGLRAGAWLSWSNPAGHVFLDGRFGARIEDEDLPNITVMDERGRVCEFSGAGRRR
ncbi:hypothetical protein Agub_g1166, partial [Astrephomene gubernaculifera]